MRPLLMRCLFHLVITSLSNAEFHLTYPNHLSPITVPILTGNCSNVSSFKRSGFFLCIWEHWGNRKIIIRWGD